MLSVLAHEGSLQPHDLAWAWNLDPVLLVGLVAAAWAYGRGRRRTTDTPGRQRAFAGALAALAVALVSPLEALSGVLASAHMVQHVLLVVVAAPLLAWSAPGAAVMRGLPRRLRAWNRAARVGAGLDADRLRATRAPVVRWLAHVVVLWLWHASALYGAAVEHEVVHVLEHATFVGTAWLVWSVILGPARVRVPPGLALLGVFGLALQGVLLSALLTFARTPWYEPYVEAAPAWGVDALEDQQLAGVVMWVPAGLVHVAIAIALLAAWLRDVDADARAPAEAAWDEGPCTASRARSTVGREAPAHGPTAAGAATSSTAGGQPR